MAALGKRAAQRAALGQVRGHPVSDLAHQLAPTAGSRAANARAQHRLQHGPPSGRVQRPADAIPSAASCLGVRSMASREVGVTAEVDSCRERPSRRLRRRDRLGLEGQSAPTAAEVVRRRRLKDWVAEESLACCPWQRDEDARLVEHAACADAFVRAAELHALEQRPTASCPRSSRAPPQSRSLLSHPPAVRPHRPGFTRILLHGSDSKGMIQESQSLCHGMPQSKEFWARNTSFVTSTADLDFHCGSWQIDRTTARAWGHAQRAKASKHKDGRPGQ